MGVSRLQSKLNHVLWVNEAADFVGGCEQYIFNTVGLLREQGIRSTLLYDCLQKRFSADFVNVFDQAFPLVDVKTQVADICPDVVYVHRLSGGKVVRELKKTGIPTARFFHDYQLFCPREHRYTTFGRQTCSKPIGMRCYFPCFGFINRSDSRMGFRFTFVRALRSEIKANQDLDAFVVGSNYMAKLIAENGIDQQRIHAIPLYALPPETTLSVTREPGLLLFAGQLIRSKGIDTLLEALALTEHPCRLAIAGHGRQEDMFRQMVKNLGIEERVSFLGKLSHEELAEWFSKATCVVVPSRYPETFGLVGPEAMRYGAAIVGTSVGAISEWLDDGVTGILVPPNDARALAGAIGRLVQDPQRAVEMGAAGKRRYLEHFMPEMHIKILLALFRGLVRKGGVRV